VPAAAPRPRRPVGAQAALERRRAAQTGVAGPVSEPVDRVSPEPYETSRQPAVAPDRRGPVPPGVGWNAGGAVDDDYGGSITGQDDLGAGRTGGGWVPEQDGYGRPDDQHRSAGYDDYGRPGGYGADDQYDRVDEVRAPGEGYDEYGGYDRGYDDYDDLGEDELDDAELDELPKRRGCRSALVVLGVILVVVLVAGWFAWSWAQDKIDPPGSPGEQILVEIPEGASTAGVGDVLAEAGVISDASFWGWYTRLNDPGTIQAGKYEMRLNSSFDEAIDDLQADPLPPEAIGVITIPEGFTQEQIRARLANPEQGIPGTSGEAVDAAFADPEVRSPILPEGKPLEGTLFPETYGIEEGDTVTDIVTRMHEQFESVATEVQLTAKAEQLGYTPYEILIVASMVEREAGIPADMPKVARVIYNRIADGEPIGIDATSCYEEGEIPCSLTTAELEDGTPYDTRTQTGFPPTPISSPGQAALEAALNPADGDWHWYVLDVEADDGSSLFTNDYDGEFLPAKARCEAAGKCG
jgi:UPF0755 protein